MTMNRPSSMFLHLIEIIVCIVVMLLFFWGISTFVEVEDKPAPPSVSSISEVPEEKEIYESWLQFSYTGDPRQYHNVCRIYPPTKKNEEYIRAKLPLYFRMKEIYYEKARTFPRVVYNPIVKGGG